MSGLAGEHLLVDLQQDRLRRQAGSGQLAGDRLGQADVEQVPGRDIHRDLDRQPVLPPARGLRQGHLDHARGEIAHQVRVLDQRDELVRPDRAPHRMPPADQRLHPGGPAVPQVHLGLELQLKLAAVDAAAQVTEQRKAGGRVAVGVGNVSLHPAAALLRQVHRHIGVLHQQLEPGRVVRIEGKPDARLDLDRHALQADRLGDGGTQPGGDLAGRAHLADWRQQHGELVAAEPRHYVTGPDAVRQPVRHRAQQPVTGRVP